MMFTNEEIQLIIKRSSLVVPFLLLGLISGCGSHSGEKGGHQHQEGGHEKGDHRGHQGGHEKGGDGGHKGGHDHKVSEGGKKVHLSPKKVKDLGIATDTLKKLSLSGNVEANGRIRLAPKDRAELSSLLGGRVRSINVMEGDQVQKGELLAVLENTEFTRIQREYLQKKEKLPYLKKEFERQKRLLDEEVGSEREFQKARAEYQQTRSELKTLREELKMLGIFERLQGGTVKGTVPVRAPFGGYIGKVSATQGSFIPAKEQIVEVLNIEHIHLDLKVYEKDLGRVEKGQEVFFSYANRQNDELMKGKIFKVGRKYHEEEQAVRFHVKVPEKFQSQAVPGVYVKARIKAGERTATALPEEAIIRQGKKTYAFVEANKGGAHDGQAFRRIPVRTGVTDAGYTGIHPLEKVPEGASYVTEGAYYLQAELKKSVGGHHH